MRKDVDPKLTAGRIRAGVLASNDAYGLNGAFIVPGPNNAKLKLIASDGMVEDQGYGWEHVSVSLPHRCPNWPEMSMVKDLFWSADECVVQYHPPKASYVNCHPFCLHLWRYRFVDFPMPPPGLVGPAKEVPTDGE